MDNIITKDSIKNKKCLYIAYIDQQRLIPNFYSVYPLYNKSMFHRIAMTMMTQWESQITTQGFIIIIIINRLSTTHIQLKHGYEINNRVYLYMDDM